VRRGWVTLTPRAQPDPPATRTYDAFFNIYKALYPALKNSMHDLHTQAEISRERNGLVETHQEP